jgi:hypothetical protein
LKGSNNLEINTVHTEASAEVSRDRENDSTPSSEILRSAQDDVRKKLLLTHRAG